MVLQRYWRRRGRGCVSSVLCIALYGLGPATTPACVSPSRGCICIAVGARMSSADDSVRVRGRGSWTTPRCVFKAGRKNARKCRVSRPPPPRPSSQLWEPALSCWGCVLNSAPLYFFPVATPSRFLCRVCVACALFCFFKFVVHNKQCNVCNKEFTNQTWKAVVQVSLPSRT